MYKYLKTKMKLDCSTEFILLLNRIAVIRPQYCVVLLCFSNILQRKHQFCARIDSDAINCSFLTTIVTLYYFRFS